MAQNQQGVNANQQLQKQQQTAAANPYGTGNTIHNANDTIK